MKRKAPRASVDVQPLLCFEEPLRYTPMAWDSGERVTMPTIATVVNANGVRVPVRVGPSLQEMWDAHMRMSYITAMRMALPRSLGVITNIGADFYNE